MFSPIQNVYYQQNKSTIMDEILKLDLQTKIINSEEINTVNARLLHEKLEVKRDFSTWIKQRIEKYDFIENQDYIKINHNTQLSKENRVHNLGEPENQGFMTRPIDYYLTIDMAKELCMVENNEKGRLWRKYFITCEKMLFAFERNKYKQLTIRKDETQSVQDVYGKEAPWYIYSNYTKLVYRKVFGISDVKHIKKMFHLSEKEELRKSPKIPIEYQKKIADTEQAVYCFLKTLEYQQADKEECYSRVKQFLFPAISK